jgi:hypothetical protein
MLFKIKFNGFLVLRVNALRTDFAEATLAPAGRGNYSGDGKQGHCF